MREQRALALAHEIKYRRQQLFDHALPELEAHYASFEKNEKKSFKGKGVELINEAQVRAIVIDPILASLNWSLTGNTLVEAGVETTDSRGNRRFLDYFGRETTNESEALILVEAKRLSVELPTYEKGMDSRQAVVEALSLAFKPKATSESLPITDSLSATKKLPEKVTLPEVWRDIFLTLKNYVERLKQSKFGIPKRVLLTNGNWFVIFLDPEKSLLVKSLSAEDFVVAINLEDAARIALKLVDEIAYESLANEFPIQHCENFSLYAAEADEPLSAVMTYEVMTAAMGGISPSIVFQPSILVKIPSGAWMRFKDEYENPTHFRQSNEKYLEDLIEFRTKASTLFNTLNNQYPLRLIEADEFERLRPGVTSITSNPLVKKVNDDYYIFHVGSSMTPFTDNGNFHDCLFHSHGEALKARKPVRADAVIRPEARPFPVHFTSGSVNHCAHNDVHKLKINCPINNITNYFCCRACPLQERCWKNDFSKFPCVAAS